MMNDGQDSRSRKKVLREDAAEICSTMQLMELARNGDQDSMDQLFVRYLPRMRRWAHGRIPYHARGLLDTEDLVQDSLLGTLKNIEGISAKNEGSFAVYLRTVILNRIRDAGRRLDLMSPLDSRFPDQRAPDPSPLEDLIGKDTLEAYDRALQSLTEQEQAAVIGRIEMGVNYAELALILGKPSPDAARMAVGRALARLAKEMGLEKR